MAASTAGLAGWQRALPLSESGYGAAVLGDKRMLGLIVVCRGGSADVHGGILRIGIGALAASVHGSGDVGVLLSVGADVDRRLGDNVLIGVRGSAERVQGDESVFRQAVGIGVHLSVGWDSR